MSVTDFETRRNRVLEAVIEAYVASASPIGSAYISRRFRPAVSSATIRNVMGELEGEGLLEQPHTSAGRVPTARGFRHYVDGVMAVPALSREQRGRMRSLIEPDEADVDQLMERASEALAELTHQAAFVVAPTVKQSTVRQIELVPLGVRRVLCVLVANEEMVASHVVEIEEPMTRDETRALSRFINTELTGLPFSDLVDSLERRLLAEQDAFYYMVKRSLMLLQHALSTEPDQRLFLEGTSYVVAQPEFSRTPRKAHELLKCLEDPHELLSSLKEDVGPGGVRVRIGRERSLRGMHDCSTVSASFTVGDEMLGGLGVLGPVRMDYRWMTALVDGMARTVTGVLTEWTSE
jgi:heat-inducible transcriptional repressor